MKKRRVEPPEYATKYEEMIFFQDQEVGRDVSDFPVVIKIEEARWLNRRGKPCSCRGTSTSPRA